MNNKIISLFLLGLAVSSCSKSQSSPDNQSGVLPSIDPLSVNVVVRAKAEFDLKTLPDGTASLELVKKSYSSGNNCSNGQCVDYSDVSIVNTPSTQFALAQSGQQVNKSGSNTLLNLVSLSIGTLFDNDLHSCGGSKCSLAMMRIYTTSVNAGPGLYNAVNGESAHLFVTGPAVSTPLDVPYGQSNALVLSQLSIDNNKEIISLPDFASDSYPLTADLTSVGAGTYNAHVVVEYDLGGGGPSVSLTSNSAYQVQESQAFPGRLKIYNLTTSSVFQDNLGSFVNGNGINQACNLSFSSFSLEQGSSLDTSSDCNWLVMSVAGDVTINGSITGSNNIPLQSGSATYTMQEPDPSGDLTGQAYSYSINQSSGGYGGTPIAYFIWGYRGTVGNGVGGAPGQGGTGGATAVAPNFITGSGTSGGGGSSSNGTSGVNATYGGGSLGAGGSGNGLGIGVGGGGGGSGGWYGAYGGTPGNGSIGGNTSPFFSGSGGDGDFNPSDNQAAGGAGGNPGTHGQGFYLKVGGTLSGLGSINFSGNNGGNGGNGADNMGGCVEVGSGGGGAGGDGGMVVIKYKNSSLSNAPLVNAGTGGNSGLPMCSGFATSNATNGNNGVAGVVNLSSY